MSCVLEHLHLAEQPELMAGDEAGILDEIGGPDGFGAETQVRYGDRCRLLRVVHEVALGEQVGAFADDLDRRLVRADRAVRAEPEEHRLHFARRTWVPEVGVDRQAEVCDVVVDADREMTLRPRRSELFEDRLDHRWRHLLRGQAVSTADGRSRRRRERGVIAVHRFGQGRDDLQVERLADSARLFRPVEHRDGARVDGSAAMIDRRRRNGWNKRTRSIPTRSPAATIVSTVSSTAPAASPSPRSRGPRRARRGSRPARTGGRSVRQLVQHLLDDPGQPGGTGSMPRAPGRRSSGSGRCPGRPGHRASCPGHGMRGRRRRGPTPGGRPLPAPRSC